MEADIYFTLDGSDVSVKSNLYLEPITINDSKILKAISVKNGLISKQIEAEFTKTPKGRSIKLLTQYGSQYSAGGDKALIDYLRGPNNYMTGSWQGYEGVNLEVIIDLGKITNESVVLEIGPGDGRQMCILATMANTYSIADISEAVVKKHKDKVAQSFFINTWNDDFDASFDTICLWYVFHHVLNNELETFVSFLSRHLKDGGSLVFNVPTIGQEKPDATNTTPYDVLKFKDQMLQLGFDTKDESDQQYNNYVFNMVKA